MIKIKFGIAQFLLVFSVVLTQASAQTILLSAEEVSFIGERVFENECASNNENLIAWNEGEDFLSLGIGHFIWHPANSRRIFEESFVKFLEYAKASGEKSPPWLDKKTFPECPWDSRDDFLNAKSDVRLIELKEFLIRTKPLQSAFILKRLEDALPLILMRAPESSREKIASQFNRVASAPSGIYALADYVNFKGLGIALSENYQGKSWGLLQVLEGMRGEIEAPDAIREFALSANIVLMDRVKNSPLGRNEQKWLPGWQKRVDSYIK
ncbi:MAG: hypothetical protein ABH882_00275 [Candidatus Omnitrophota bacterium]|nr:hypothetical protein [Candidatus Omnitrophota bacterium]MBU1929839.1 hypothetical protein [Candidatus Omnitrophota bacterium]MBU2034684.1 hypothetical protein [Candidatus Omnitrophota bacterium]MBU2222202.1 hypothetical protein [Candidatus Omnitrophota bacterium]MBU2258571.1 hypothetical protein [Candidatus Omnitrophota bacterium]